MPSSALLPAVDGDHTRIEAAVCGADGPDELIEALRRPDSVESLDEALLSTGVGDPRSR